MTSWPSLFKFLFEEFTPNEIDLMAHFPMTQWEHPCGNLCRYWAWIWFSILHMAWTTAAAVSFCKCSPHQAESRVRTLAASGQDKLSALCDTISGLWLYFSPLTSEACKSTFSKFQLSHSFTQAYTLLCLLTLYTLYLSFTKTLTLFY